MVEEVPGDPASPVLLHVPHAGTAIPAWVRERILLDDAALAAEVAALTDHRTDEIAAAAGGGAWRIVHRLSRFTVDVERFPDEREEMTAVGMGAVYTCGTRGQPLRDDDPEHREALLAAYYRPWAAAVERLVGERIAATGRAVLVDVHSYPREPLPYELHAAGQRPEVCLGTDPRHTPPWLLAAARAAFAGFEVACDSPFAGMYVPLAFLGDPRVCSLMVEIRRDVHVVREAELTAALGALVAAAERGR